MLNTVQELNLLFDYKGDPVTLQQALASCRTSGMGDYLLLYSINYVQWTREFVAIYHGEYKEEAQTVIDNLISLCCEHFGKEVKLWFTEAWDANAHHTYNQQTQTVEEDVAFENNDSVLLTSYFSKDLNHSSNLDSNLDHETNRGPVVPTTFISTFLF